MRLNIVINVFPFCPRWVFSFPSLSGLNLSFSLTAFWEQLRGFDLQRWMTEMCGPESKNLFACVEHSRPDLCFLTSWFVCLWFRQSWKRRPAARGKTPRRCRRTWSSTFSTWSGNTEKTSRWEWECFSLLPAVTRSVEVGFKFLPKEIKTLFPPPQFFTHRAPSPLSFCAPLFTSRHHRNTRLLFPVFAACLSLMTVPHFCLFLLTPFGVFFVKPFRLAALFVSWLWSEAPLLVLCLSLSRALSLLESPFN